MRIGNGLIASMEDIDNDAPVDELESAETAVAVADDSAEVQADGDEIGVTVSEVEDAVQAGEELEDIADVATAAVETGEGLDENAAELASIAVESILNRIGVRSHTRLVPATESFGNSNTRLSSTKLIVEGIGDYLKKIWQAIKAAAARLWDKIRSFFAKLFNSAAQLSKLIASLKTRAGKVDGAAKQKEKSIKHAGVAKAIGVKKQANLATFKAVFENTEKLADVAKSVADQNKIIVSAVEDLAKGDITEAGVKAFLGKKNGAVETIGKVFESSFAHAGAELGGAALKAPKTKKGSTSTTALYGPFVGSVAVSFTTEKAGNDLNFKISFGGAPGQSAESVAALSISEIREVLDMSGKLAFKIQDLKKTQDSMDAITKSVNKVADTIISQAGKVLEKTGSSAETRQGLDELKTSVNQSLATLGQFGSTAPSLQFNLAKAGADYASVALRNLGGE